MKKIILISLVLALYFCKPAYSEWWSCGAWKVFYYSYTKNAYLTKDGSILSKVVDKQTIFVYNTKTKKTKYIKFDSTEIFMNYMQGAAISDDGKYFSFLGYGGQKVYNIEGTPFLYRNLPMGPNLGYFLLRFSEDAKFLTRFNYGSRFPCVTRWNIEENTLISSIDIPNNDYSGFNIPSNNGEYAIWGSEKNDSVFALFLYDVKKQNIDSLNLENYRYYDDNIAISYDGKYIVYSSPYSKDAQTFIYDVEKKEIKHTINKRAKYIRFCDYTMEIITETFVYDIIHDKIVWEYPEKSDIIGRYDNYLINLEISCSMELDAYLSTFKITNLKDNSIVGYIPPGHDSPVYDFIFSPDGSKLASIDSFKTYIWETKTGYFIASINKSQDVAFIPDSKYLLFHDSNRVTIYDYNREQNISSYKISDSKILKIFSFNSYMVFCCLTENKIFFVKYPDMNIINQFSIPQGASVCHFKIDYQKNALLLLSNGKFYRWIVEDRNTVTEEVNTLNYSQGFTEYSYDGKFVTDNTYIINTQNGQKQFNYPSFSMYFLPGNQNVLIERRIETGLRVPLHDFACANYLGSKEVNLFYDYHYDPYCPIDRYLNYNNCFCKQLQISPDGRHFAASEYYGGLIYSSIPIDTTVSVESRNFINNNILQCFPNPMENEAVLYFHSDFEFNSANIEIFNNIGLKVKSFQKAITAGENKVSIDTEKLPNGIYFIRLLTNDRVYYTKAMVRK